MSCPVDLTEFVSIRKAGPVRLEPTCLTSTAVVAVARECLDHWQANVGQVGVDGDPSALHQTRVGLRRFRSALSLFRRALDDPQVEWLGDEVRELALPLGDARDLDVLMAEPGLVDRLDPSALSQLSEQRRAAYVRVSELLDSTRWADVWVLVERFLDRAPWDLEPDPPAVVTAADALQRRWRRILRDGGDLAALSAADRHRVRIQAKKLRYGAQFFADLFPDHEGDDPSKYASTLGRAQDALGALNDHHIQHLLLEGVGVAHPELDETAALNASQVAVDEVMALRPFWASPPV